MLPSMPLLMTPAKELNDDSSDTSDDSPYTHHPAESGLTVFESNAADTTTQAEESEQLLKSTECSSEPSNGTVKQTDTDKDKPHTPEKRSLSEPSSAQKKKKKNQHKKTLAALTPETGSSLENSAKYFAEAYFQKVRSQLDEEKWARFVQELVDFEERRDKQPADLYSRMEELLSPHTELVDEFLAFLLPNQASQVNRFMAYLLLVKMKDFLRKLGILLMKRQARQVYGALESLAARPGVTLAEVKAAILPLLKSSPLLTNLFLELLPGERCPDSMMTDFEQVDLKDNSLFETIVVPDCPDPYGHENCICSCHTAQKTRHCVSCGIKYGKVLRPAKVTFKGKNHLDLRKWEEDKCRSRRRLVPKTMLSPSGIDHRLNVDSEDDSGVKKSPRTPRIRAARTKACKKGASGSKEEEVLEGIFPLVESKSVHLGENMSGELVVDCETKLNGSDDHEFDEGVIETECNTEEDEEEDLNKCLHSENDSSLEAEDIVKGLELGNECSFEDEELEDTEIGEAIHSEILNTNINGKLDQDDSVKVGDSMDIEECDIKTEFSIEGNIDTGLENHNSLVKVELEPTCTNLNEDETNIQQISTSNQVETIKVEPSTKQNSDDDTRDDNMDTSCDIKVEIDNCYEQSGSSMECGETLHEEPSSSHVCASGKKSEEEASSSNSGGKSVELYNTSKEWSREEDKIILQAFQHENELEQTFETAILQLHRSKEEVQARFEVLLKLLKEMISDESNSNP